MKNLINKFLMICCISLLVFSCKKDEIKTIAKSGAAPALAASQNSLVLTAANAADTVETFTWAASDYGFSAAVKYTLQIAKAGTNFAKPKEINLGSSTVQKYTGGDFNQLAILQGLPFNTIGQLEVRVKSAISDSINAIYSNQLTVTITPYQVIINYPSLWIPGDYQGWDPATAPKISSKTGNGVYEGYTQIPAGGTLQFKLTSDPDWNHTVYGWASSTVNGTIVTGTMNTTGGNLFFPIDGYYLVTANTNAGILTWGVKKTTWAIIGDAPTLSNNWANDVPLVYDAAKKTWSVTTTFAVGAFKFRANGDWNDGTNNFGDNGADLSLDYGGDNIAIKTAGTHTVTMDLHIPGSYSYTIQ